MKDVCFVTGNQNKLKEANEILGFVIEHADIDLSEIQSIIVSEVVKHKAIEAYKQLGKPVLVEDVGVYIVSWNNYPGALIKWLLKSVGVEGIAHMMKNFKNKDAYAEANLCYFDGRKCHIFVGRVKGKIVEPRGKTNFDWDPIFEVDKTNKTYAEMTTREKNNISHRKMAFEKFREFLEN